MANLDQLVTDLQSDEGFRSCVYKDSEGFWTIGFGCMVDSLKGGGITVAEGVYLLKNRVMICLSEMGGLLPFWGQLDDTRQNVLLNMCFNLGAQGVMEFREMLACLSNGDYSGAADQMINSKWATQVPERANRLAEEMRNGGIESA